MNELTMLRSTRADIAPPTKQALDRGRAALFGRIGESTSPVTTPVLRHPRRRWVAMTSVAAVAIAAALVVSNLAGIGVHGQSAAADVLHRSALATIKTADPVVPPGKFLRVTTSAVYSKTSGGVSYLTLSNDELYVPADRSQDWVWVRGASAPYKTFGTASAAQAAKSKTAMTELVRAPAGGFYSRLSDSSAAAFAQLPRDPHSLLAYIHKRNAGSDLSVDAGAYKYIADELMDGLAPADLRAALYETAALIPGVVVEEKQVTLNGSVGVAIGRTDTNSNSRDELIIDPKTGVLIGQREVLIKAESGMPAGTAIGWTAKTTAIVDGAPAGGTINGAFDTMGCTVTGPDEFQC